MSSHSLGVKRLHLVARQAHSSLPASVAPQVNKKNKERERERERETHRYRERERAR